MSAPLERVDEQHRAEPLPANREVNRQAGEQDYRDRVLARQPSFVRHALEGDRAIRQRVVAQHPVLPRIDSHVNAADVLLLMLKRILP